MKPLKSSPTIFSTTQVTFIILRDTSLLTFYSSVLQQVDGVAMRSPLGPIFANIFLSFHESTWLSNCLSTFKPVYYRRYVDDCFLLFRERKRVNLFFNFLNEQHSSIKFSSEVETNNTLSFLDIKIIRPNGSFSTSVYQKPTFTELFTNFQFYSTSIQKRFNPYAS